MENTATDEKRSSLWWLSLAIPLIPTIGAIGYLMAYIYEWQFCNAFGIPKEFIAINWNNILIACIVIVSLTVALLAINFIPLVLFRIGIPWISGTIIKKRGGILTF